MLKRLELVGFKSFADKTQFDFPPGITAVVGPNGSGKSNIVDAVRWTLGEQSAKSLRGGEMADVIFNGSTSRRSLGLAEVTLTFDNVRRTLATDADEVAITRRVYRDGEGEYLINHEPTRLRDIKELLLGSGAGADAYCIIEQGKVDVLLQASTRDRRTIFEEAAGTSRFKAKKTETLRKLERVDQNLERVKDIIEEVEKQLRSVKLQAAKAQRYQEYHSRLRELRIALGLREFHELTGRLEAETGVLAGLKAGLEERAARVEAWEDEARRREEALARLDDEVHAQEAALADARQRIAAAETTIGHERALSADLETEFAATGSRLAELAGRVDALAAEAARAAAERAEAEGEGNARRGQSQALEGDLAATAARLADLQAQIESGKAEHLERMRQAARLHNDAVACQARLDNLRAERDRLRHKTELAAGHLATLDLELQELTEADQVLQARLLGARGELTERRHDRERLVRVGEETSQALADLRARRSGLVSRIEVLEGLERSYEGLGTGVRELIAALEEERAAAAPDGPWRCVLGLAADLLTVRREFAPLIDLALGERAQQFLVREPQLLADALRRRAQPFSGRVSFRPVATAGAEDDGPEGAARDLPAEVAAHPGVVALASELVSCQHPGLDGLPSQLLGKTLVVHNLDAARSLASRPGGYRFVTLQGELLEADGTLTVGTHHAEGGLLSRKSERRELGEQVTALGGQIAGAEAEVAALRERVADLDRLLGSAQEEIEVLAEQAADLRSRIGQRRQRHEGLHEEVALNRGEIGRVEADIDRLAADWDEARRGAEAADRDVLDLQDRLDAADREVRDCGQERQRRQQELTAVKVELAKAEERMAGSRARHRQAEADLEQRRREHAQGEERLAAGHARLEESRRSIARASDELARSQEDRRAAEGRVARLNEDRDRQRRQRHELDEQAQAVRAEWRAIQEEAHARELAANDVRHRRDALADRLREDYHVELGDLYRDFTTKAQRPRSDGGEHTAANGAVEIGTKSADSSMCLGAESLDPAAAGEEIAELCRKLSRLGSVNLEALQELAELEGRAQTLRTQFDDLTAAKRSLEEIIATINQDSRRLFTETFNAVRTHFQELFRKLFGGGMADVILEDESDVLESGIEVIARPPGKELRSISLMSGGEKTLTAVALLLAIFRSKPSPFCILDEVDAALDEANIGRFTAVLHDFLDRSQFIIVTHSKKTMAVADVLYGVTMQESGVSKRVAVRFEDWPEDGRPSNGQAAGAAENGAPATLAGR
jgi:chromosome segregation protein